MLILVKKVYADIQSTVEEATNQAMNNLSTEKQAQLPSSKTRKKR